MSRRTGIRTTAAGLALAAVACLWVAFGPAQLGGRASYALLAGSSMEPGLHRGDLAIVRRHDGYRIGDVILFRDRLLGRDVLHRVVARDGSRLVTKGDNNGYRDSFRPAARDVHGALWLHVPAAGRPLEWLRAPSHTALLVGLTALAVLALGSGAAAEAGRRRRARPALGLRRETLFAGALAAVGVFAFAALVAWTRPATRAVSRQAYEQRAEVSYRASVPTSEVYADGSVDTGEPVFVRLVRALEITFDWKLASALPHDAAGRATLDVVLSDGHGWERRLPLAASRRFSGGRVRLSGRLDLDRVRAAVERVDELTGAGLTTWSLAVRPSVAARATVGGTAVDLAFATPVAFTLDGVRLQPDGGDAGEPQLAQRVGGTLEQQAAAPLAFGIGDRTVRIGSLLGLLVAAGIAAWARAGRRDAPTPPGHELVAARLGGLLVEAVAAPPARGHVIELGDLDGLLRVAEASGRLVVHAATPFGDEYVVEDGGTAYRFRTGRRSRPDAVLRAVAGR